MDDKGLFIGGIGHTKVSTEARKRAREIIDNMDEFHTEPKFTEDGVEIYEPEPVVHSEMVRRSNKAQQDKYNAYLTKKRNERIKKENNIQKKKNKAKMKKKSKKQNRRKK